MKLTPASRLALDRAAAWRRKQPAIYAGLSAGIGIAGLIAWRMGTLGYFVGGFS